jgi:hypothetical protein
MDLAEALARELKLPYSTVTEIVRELSGTIRASKSSARRSNAANPSDIKLDIAHALFPSLTAKE